MYAAVEIKYSIHHTIENYNTYLKTKHTLHLEHTNIAYIMNY